MNERQWYYAIGQQHGPVPESELIELFRRAVLGPESYVWADGFTDWQKASQVAIFAPLFSQFPAASSVAPGRPASVTVFGILNIIFGSLGLICLPFSLLITFGMPQKWAPTNVAIIWLIIVHTIDIIRTIFLLTLGIELLRLRAWARKWTLVYSWFSISWVVIGSIVNLFLITSGEFGYAEEILPSALGGTCGGLIGSLIYPVLLIIFMQKARVKNTCIR